MARMRRVRIGRRPAAVGVLLVVAAVAAGCATPGPMPTPTPSSSYSPGYTAPAVQVLAPLTGELVEPGSLDHPSLAAKIDNHVEARPQEGLDRTDLVFEELVEGGLTRYVAVWHSDIPKEIGPIRSIRPMDPDIISPLGGIVAYSGGQYRFVVLMQSTDVFNAVHGYSDMADIMFRAPDRGSPHDVIVRAQTLIRRYDDIHPPKQQFAFADDVSASTAAIDGTPIASATITFSPASKPGWTWDADRGVWLRSQLGTADTDSHGDRLTATNVVVVRVPISFGLGVPKTELIGDGRAWILSDGKVVEAHWKKSTRTGLIQLTDDSGAAIRLAPGNTWIELMPTSGRFRSE